MESSIKTTDSQLHTNKLKRKSIRALFIISFTIIPVLHFLLFYVYVNFSSFAMAFQKVSSGELIFAGFENFSRVFDKIINGSTNPEENLGLAFINTFKTFGAQLALFPVGLFVSYFIYKKIRGYKAFRVIFYLPTIVSAVVVSFFFQELMSSSSFFPRLLEKLFNLDYKLASPLTDSVFANKMVFLHMIWLSFPGSLIVWGGTFSRIPESVIESAKIDGVNWVRELFQIILPLVWPTFVLMLTTMLAGIFGATGSVFLLTGGMYDTQTVSNWMYTTVYRTTNPMTSNGLYQVSALGLMLTVVSCAIALFVRKVLNSRIEETQY